MRDLFEAISEYMSAEGADARRERAKKVRIEFDLVQDRLLEMQSRIEALEKDAARYALSKNHYDIRISRYKGKYRADNGSRVLTGWMDSYDECFDAAMQSEKGGV